MATAILLGVGHLTWRTAERKGNRYGSVYLLPPAEGHGHDIDDASIHVPIESSHGYGQLVAKVIEPRESYHIGDLFLGITPSLPKKNERIVLGSGLAFNHVDFGCKMVGVIPIDGRATHWLKPKNLYRLHSSIVEIGRAHV